MADKHGLVQIQLLEELGQVVGVPIHGVAVPGLVRPAMAAPIMSDDPVTKPSKKDHLAVPRIG